MPPIARTVVHFTQRIKNQPLRHRTLNLIEIATQQPDLSHFTNASLMNPSHTSNSDPIPHATVRLATDEQAAQKVSHTIHIYHDKAGNYTGHTLYVERPDEDPDK